MGAVILVKNFKQGGGMLLARTIVVSTLSLITISCGGGGSSRSADTVTTSPPPQPAQTFTGTFIDAPVSGLSYSTNTQTGVTNSSGEFMYAEGETVRFTYGGIEIGSALAKAILTPLDVLPEDSESQIALMSFLQSLDMDNDPSNGIELTNSTAQQLREYVHEEPQSNTFPSVIARDDYPDLVGQLTNRAAWISNTEALQTFDAEIAPLVAQGLYEPPAPPPVQSTNPAPVPTSVEAPRLNNSLEAGNLVPGAPFYDCGGNITMLRTPSPTAVRHALQMPETNTYSICVTSGSWEPFVFDLPDINFDGADKLIYISTDIQGDLTIAGQRIAVIMTDGATIAGRVFCAPGATNISFNNANACQ